MVTNRDSLALSQWPKMAQVVNEAAAGLEAQYGGEGIPADALMREIERIGGYRRESVLPSDYCYNRINKAENSFQCPVLVQVSRGRYQYVGPSYAYTGPILWKPKQGNERLVGTWNSGDSHLDFDPRI